jgi:uncharacterized membrane protein (DUF373 family)
MFKKSTHTFQEIPLSVLEIASKTIAMIVCISLILASLFKTILTFNFLFIGDVDQAIQDSLFVLILLEMFYIVRSFIRFGSINVSIVVSVGIIAAVKQMIFELDSMTMQLAIAFGVLFVTLSVTYYAETVYHHKVRKDSSVSR